MLLGELNEMSDNDKILEGICALNRKAGKLVLTNKHLIFLKKSGFLSTKYEKNSEVALDEIAECFSDISYLGGCKMIIKFKDGKKGVITFPGSGTQLLFGGIDSHVQTQKAQSDRWISAINNAKQKTDLNSKNNDPLHLLQIRYARGEISKAEYEEMKEVIKKK